MKLILIRHGETEGNSTDRYWGRTDVALSELGMRQAEKLRHRLKPERIDRVYTSQLKRAYRTAEIITRGREMELLRRRELNEINFGKVEGMNFEEIAVSYPELVSLWAGGSSVLTFPGGESFENFVARAQKFLNSLKEQDKDEVIAVIGHGGPFKLMACHLLGIDMSHWWQFNFSLGSISIIEVKGGEARLEVINDTSHL